MPTIVNNENNIEHVVREWIQNNPPGQNETYLFRGVSLQQALNIQNRVVNQNQPPFTQAEENEAKTSVGEGFIQNPTLWEFTNDLRVAIRFSREQGRKHIIVIRINQQRILPGSGTEGGYFVRRNAPFDVLGIIDRTTAPTPY